jgi:hypothetical protein
MQPILIASPQMKSLRNTRGHPKCNATASFEAVILDEAKAKLPFMQLLRMP